MGFIILPNQQDHELRLRENFLVITFDPINRGSLRVEASCWKQGTIEELAIGIAAVMEKDNTMAEVIMNAAMKFHQTIKK